MQEQHELHGDKDPNDDTDSESCFVWFQSSPLVFQNADATYHLPPLDIQQEQDVIQRVFHEASTTLNKNSKRKRSRVHFKNGTPRQLGSFLQLVRNEPNIQHVSLHISCHARPKYLAFEDGWGTALPITIHDLETLLQQSHGDDSFASAFQLIFIAACNSRSIGEALRNAGATHIVCAHSDQTNINVSYVLEFSKVMYSTILSSKAVGVKEAFERATTELSLYPIYRHLEPQLCLLTGEDDPSCPILRNENQARLPLQGKRGWTSSNFPKPPSYFSRHDTEVWKVLQLIKDTQDENVRIVWVTGEDDLGTKCTVQSACQSLEQRLETNCIEGIRWVEPRVHQMVCNGNYQMPLNEVSLRIKNDVQDLNTIVVLDATRLGYDSIPLLVDQISTLIETTERLKFIIINSEPLHLTWTCEDRHISIPLLCLESTVKIFGRLCRHVKEERSPGITCSNKLWEEIFRGMKTKVGENKTSFLSHSRCRAIYNGFGKGKLNCVINVARTMKQEEFLQYVSLGKCMISLDDLHSRYLLLNHSHNLQFAIYQALERRELEDARSLQYRLDMVALVLQEEPTMTELWTKLESVLNDLQEFSRNPQYAKRNAAEVNRLQTECQIIEKKIQKAASFYVQQNYFVADFDLCTGKERELEVLVASTNDLLLKFQIHQGKDEREALIASLENGNETIASMQRIIEEGFGLQETTLFASLECLPIKSDKLDCSQFLQTLRARKRSKCIVKIQALARGALCRMEQSKRKKNAFLKNFSQIQKRMQGSLHRMSCRRHVLDADKDEDDEIMTQASSVASAVTEGFKRGAEIVAGDIRKGAEELAHSIHTATTVSSCDFSHSSHRSIRGRMEHVRQVSFKVQDRWKTGAPLRELLVSKACGANDDGDEQEKRKREKTGGSRWQTGAARHEVLVPLSFR